MCLVYEWTISIPVLANSRKTTRRIPRKVSGESQKYLRMTSEECQGSSLGNILSNTPKVLTHSASQIQGLKIVV
jgi:hypothetical protein